MSLPDVPLTLISRALEVSKQASYSSAAGVTVLLLDYIHTLPAEARLIWPTRISVPKALFLVVRYGNFVFAVAEYLYTLSESLPTPGCKRMFTVLSILRVLLAGLGEGEYVLMYLRVYAFSGRNRKVLYLLSFIFLTVVTIAVVFMVKWNVHAEVFSASIVPGFSCVYIRQDNLSVTVQLAVVLASVTCLVIITMFIGYAQYRVDTGNSRSHSGGLLSQFYQGGLWHFTMLMALSIVNIVADSIHVNLQILLHGIIVTRVFLQLRAYAESHRTITSGAGGTAEVPGDRFAGAGSSIQFAVLNSKNPTATRNTTRTAVASQSWGRPPYHGY
ncbi:hypothetical protein NMY22_g2110 [Coprinellus aureogranulatus]|nr:hypothetical protein NMY22_g2110 [Coprinellus aureogranulatus]